MVLATVCGFAGAGYWIIPAIALSLTALSANKHADRARQYHDVGTSRVLALSLGATLANNLIFTAMTFAAGRAFAWLIST